MMTFLRIALNCLIISFLLRGWSFQDSWRVPRLTKRVRIKDTGPDPSIIHKEAW
jgi:hypothetical protein